MRGSNVRKWVVINDTPIVGVIQSMEDIKLWLNDETISVKMTRDIAVIQREVSVRNHHKPFPARK